MILANPAHFTRHLDAVVAALFLIEGGQGDTAARYARLYCTSDWSMPRLEVRRLRERDRALVQGLTDGDTEEEEFFSAETEEFQSDAEAMLFCTGTSRLKIRRSGLLNAAGGQIRSRTLGPEVVSNHLSLEAMALLGAAELTRALPHAA